MYMTLSFRFVHLLIIMQLILTPLFVLSLFSDVMKLGFSKPWPEAMAMITGQPKMSVLPLMEYFQPLITWLEQENKKNGDALGWPDYSWMPTTSTCAS